MGITRIVAVYRSCPVMIVVEMEEGVFWEVSLHELAEAYEFLPRWFWQELVEQYHIFQVK